MTSKIITTGTGDIVFDPAADIDANSNKIENVVDPTTAQGVATKNYSDTKIAGQALDTTITSIGAGEDGKVIAWNNGNNEFEMVANSGTGLQDVVDDTTPTLGGALDCNDNIVGKAILKDYGLESSSPSSSSGSITLDLTNGNSFQTTLTENITTVTISNPTASGDICEFVWKVTQDSTARTITFPAAVKWPGGTAPTISTGSGDIDILTFTTWDGGTTWYGNFQQDYS